MIGSSKEYSVIELLNYNGSTGVFSDASPLAALLDNRNFGAISANIFQNTQAIRKYNSTPYLDRNYVINSSNNIGSNAITIRLFITLDEYNALKTADPSITSPANLVAIHQPYTTNNAAPTYSPVGGQETLSPIAGAASPGGFYLEFSSKGLGKYFIFKKGAAFNSLNATAQTLNSQNFIISNNPTLLIGNTLNIKTGNENVTQMLFEIFGEDGKEIYKQSLPYQSQTIKLPALVNGLYKVRISAQRLLFTCSLVK